MVRALIGAVVATVAMYIIGYVFFATPLYRVATASLDDHQAAAVQQVMASNMPRTGTYYVPETNTRAQAAMFTRGPIATIHYNMGGFSPADPTVMVAGFVQRLVAALLGAIALYLLSRRIVDFGAQMRIAAFGIVAALVFTRLSGPVWMHHDWGYAIYQFIADGVSLLVAALIILKLLPKPAATAAAAEQAGATSELS